MCVRKGFIANCTFLFVISTGVYMGLRPTRRDKPGWMCVRKDFIANCTFLFVISTGVYMGLRPTRRDKPGWMCDRKGFIANCTFLFVISTGAKRSGEICGFYQSRLRRESVMSRAKQSRPSFTSTSTSSPPELSQRHLGPASAKDAEVKPQISPLRFAPVEMTN